MAGSSFNALDSTGATIKVGSVYDSNNATHYPSSRPGDDVMISQFLDTNGNATGTFSATGDYSSAADDFYIQPSAGQVWCITRLIGSLEYGSALRADRYGGAALTNGVKVIVDQNSTETDLTAQDSVKTVAQWASYCHDLSEHSFGTGDNYVTFRWTFLSAGVGIYLDGDTTDKLIVRVNDNHTDLVFHRFMVQGFKL